MFKLFIVLYSLTASPLQILVFLFGSIFNAKIRQGLIGRIGAIRKLKSFISSVDKRKRIILIHSSSVGEWEQSVPIINKLKERHKDLIFIVTFFSPSGYNHVKTGNIDYKMYLPFDDPFSTLSFFKIIKPACWMVAKYDLWPNAVFAAKQTGTPIILSSAELAEDSSRHIGILKYFNRLFYSKLDYILAVSKEYKERFSLVYNDPERIIVTGDARYDQIYQKAKAFSTNAPLKLFNNDFPTIICGSTWPEDEKIIFPALADLCEANKQFNLAIVPHEISEQHNAEIEQYWKNKAKVCERFTNLPADPQLKDQILIVDTIGLLAKLYQSADIVYVGGSFSSGVHNVAEPAAFANPIVFGPKYKNSFEAKELLKLGAAHSIQNSEEALKTFSLLLSDKQERDRKGAVALTYLSDNLGAADKTVEIIAQYLN